MDKFSTKLGFIHVCYDNIGGFNPDKDVHLFGGAESISIQENIKMANVVADAMRLDLREIHDVTDEDIKDIQTFADSLSRAITKREDAHDPSAFKFPVVFKDNVHEYLLDKLRKPSIEARSPIIIPKNDKEIAKILYEESKIPGYYLQTSIFLNEERIPETALVSTPPEAILK